MPPESLILRSIYLQWLLAQIFPQLRKWPVQEWPRVLDVAVAKDFDQYEVLGILAAVAFVTWLLKPDPSPDVSLLVVCIHQAILSIPFLVCLAGPFYLRRIRRGIAEQDDGMQP